MSRTRNPARTQRVLAAVLDVLNGPSFRGLEGRRHSAADQQHLDRATDHLVKAGAQLPGAAVDETDDAGVASPTTAQDRYRDTLTRRFANLRAASRAFKAQAAATPLPRMRTLEECRPPDPYAPHLKKRRAGRRSLTTSAAEIREAHDPRVDPRYDPFGQPPDPYFVGLTLRRLVKEDEAEARAASAPPDEPGIVYDAHGIPDPYATALARRTR